MPQSSRTRYKRRLAENEDDITQESATSARKAPRTTKWNPDILSGGYGGLTSSRDPRIKVESDETPFEGRRWMSRAVATKQTRVSCWRSASSRISNMLDVHNDDSPDDSVVCTVCRVNCDTSPRQRRSLPFSEWATSGKLPQRPCHYCLQIAYGASILAKSFSIDPEEFHLATLKVKILENNQLEIEVVIFWVAPDGDKTEHMVFVTDIRKEIHETTRNGQMVDAGNGLYSNALTSAFAQTEALLNICRTQHEGCQSKSNFMPTRLLEIQTADGREEIRVIETNSLQPVEYAALSYCWGHMRFMQLLQDLQTEMAVSISWKELPRLYQDVIVFTRRVKIRYLWIDALCIVQDSPADWDRESALMGKVYHHASVTIGATSCKDPGVSLCGVQCKDLVLHLSRTQEKKFGSNFRHLVGRPTGGDLTYPLHYRAWTWQELLLSSRFLDFDSCGMKLHCKAGTSERDQLGDTIGSRSQDFRLPWAFRRSWA